MSLLNEQIPPVAQPFACQTPETATPEPEVTLRPAYEISETAAAWNLTVHLPGVAREGLEFTAEDGQLTIRGRRSWQPPASWTALRRETPGASFALILAQGDAVDTDKIEATFKDGVLLVTLPKPEAQKPRKIAVN